MLSMVLKTKIKMHRFFRKYKKYLRRDAALLFFPIRLGIIIDIQIKNI
jgi:hypothetical protein